MATTADDLLQEAHGALRRSLRSLPARGQHRSGRPELAFDRAAAVLAAWPALAEAQLRMLRSEVLAPPQHLQRRAERVVAVLERVTAGASVPDIEPDPQFVRATALIRAAGDALASTTPPQGYSRPSDGTVDQVLDGIATAAQITGIYIEAAEYVPLSVTGGLGRNLGGATAWFSVAAEARNALASADPSTRSSEAGSVPIVSPREVGLAAALERWRTSALRVSAPTRVPTADLPVVSFALVDIHRAAWDAGLPGAGSAAKQWRQLLVEGWGSTRLSIPGPADPDLRAATTQLRQALESSAGPISTGTGPEADALQGFLRSHGEVITAAFAQQVRTVVQSEQAVISARLLTSVLERPYPAAVAAAALRGRWVPLPASSAPAQTLLDTTAAAQRASGDMVAGVRAREMNAHNFPSGRAFGHSAGAGQAPTPAASRLQQVETELGRGLDR